MIEIEFDEHKIDKYGYRGQEIVRLTRFVHQDDNAFAVYYINFTRAHFPKVACGLVVLCEWGDGTEPRTVLPFRLKFGPMINELIKIRTGSISFIKWTQITMNPLQEFMK